MAIGLLTYQDAVKREDLTDVVTNVDYQNTPLLSGLPKGADAKSPLHQYSAATFVAAAANAAVEAAEFSAVDLVQPSRLDNNTQILYKYIQVSGTEMNTTSVTDAWTYQTNKALKEWARDAELTIMGGSRASGNSGWARQMTGIKNAITTNRSTVNSGDSLGEDVFNSILQAIYDGGTDDVASEVYVGGTLKRTISNYTAGNTKNVSADDKRLIRPVDVYVSDFGMIKVFLHRHVAGTAGNREAVFINPNYHVISYLQGRRTKLEKLAKTGDADKAQIIGEFTVEHRAEKTGAFFDGYLQ